MQGAGARAEWQEKKEFLRNTKISHHTGNGGLSSGDRTGWRGTSATA